MIHPAPGPEPLFLIEVSDRHDVVHALSLLRQVRGGQAGGLISHPGAGAFLGPLWWQALCAVAQSDADGPQMPMILDCGLAAGRAAEAIRMGQRELVLLQASAGHAPLSVFAAQCGVRLWSARPAALSLTDASRVLCSATGH